MLFYKIVEKNKATGRYKFLFHDRTKDFKVGDELIATKKMVYEAYNKKTKEKILYLSGIHVIETLDLCQKYLKRFKNKNNKTILKVQAFNFTKKPNGRPGVFLADKIEIIEEIFFI